MVGFVRPVVALEESGRRPVHGWLGRPVWLLLAWFAVATSAAASSIPVSNDSDLVNGDTSSPGALKADPGPDGVSLREALMALNQVPGPHSVRFEAALSGATILLQDSLPILDRDGVTVTGDVDLDGVPDVTLNGAAYSVENAFFVFASGIEIRGLILQGFWATGVKVFNDSFDGRTLIEDVRLIGNRVEVAPGAVDLYNWGQGCTIRDVLIEGNEFYGNTGGAVNVAAALGQLQTDNQILNVTIRDNVFVDGGAASAIVAKAASDRSSERNLLSGVEILGNTFTGYTSGAVSVIAAHDAHSVDNHVEGLRIRGNRIEGGGIFIVAGDGYETRENTVTGTEVHWNTLIGGGIQIATGWDGAHDNTISETDMAWNRISDCVANGFHLSAGSSGAHHNLLTGLTLLDNLIVDCADAGVLLHGEDGATPDNVVDGVTITNQTIVGNGNPAWAGGINVNSKHSSNVITGVEIRNSILWGNAGNDAIRGSVTPGLVRHTLLNDVRFTGLNGDFYQDPSFVDPANADYRLDADSPAVDAGDASWEAVGVMDLRANQRLWNGDGAGAAEVDLGAFEHGSPDDLSLTGFTMDELVEAAGCSSITVDDLEVLGGGSLILWTGVTVSLGDGFEVAPGGALRVVTDPVLACDPAADSAP